MVLACLKQLVSLSENRPFTDDPQTTCELVGYSVYAERDEAIREAREVLEASMLPAPREVIIKELVRMRALSAVRASDTDDVAMILSAYAEALAEYPADATVAALRWWPRRNKWWPALAEIEQAIADRCIERQMLDKALRSPSKSAPAVEPMVAPDRTPPTEHSLAMIYEKHGVPRPVATELAKLKFADDYEPPRRPLEDVLAEAKTYRLPDDTDPQVREWLRQMGGATATTEGD